MSFSEELDLACEDLGGAVLYANDEFFAPKENLLKAATPVFIEHKYTPRGKWMDGWESRRKRVPGHDFAIIRLGLPGVLDGLVVDTGFFRGNYPDSCSVDACSAPADTPIAALLEDVAWIELLSRSELLGDSQNAFALSHPWRVTHLRLNIFPDGGVARLRAHGRVLPEPRLDPGAPFDLAAAPSGGRVLACSDMFFSSRHNLIRPGDARHMGEGWETRRRRGPGHDWALLQLACPGQVEQICVDTSHFKGNYPDSCSIEACLSSTDPVEADALPWQVLLPQTKLQAHTRHLFGDALCPLGPVSHLRFNIHPDGGVARLRVYGRASAEGRRQMGLARLNALLPDEARAALLGCCGAESWAAALADARPFASAEALQQVANEQLDQLAEADWLQAFKTHPRIGGREAESAVGKTAADWSRSEQAGMQAAGEDAREALARGNEQYFQKFGYIFIICATGLSAETMRAALESRLQNEPAVELGQAAAEQRRITHLRLEKLVTA